MAPADLTGDLSLVPAAGLTLRVEDRDDVVAATSRSPPAAIG